MRHGAPTRLDRALLAVVSGPLGHLVGTAIEIGPTVASIARDRLRARLRRVRHR